MRQMLVLWLSSCLLCAWGPAWVSEPASGGTSYVVHIAAVLSRGLTPSPVVAAELRLPAVFRAGPVEIRDAAGLLLYSFKPRAEDSVTFSVRDGHEICQLTFHKGVLKAQTPNGQPLFELKPKADKVMLKDASGSQELFKFKRKGPHIDMYTAGESRMYRLQRREHGYRLENQAGETLFRAKEKEGKMVLRDAQERTVLSSKDIRHPLGLLFFRIPELSLEQQAACFVFFGPVD